MKKTVKIVAGIAIACVCVQDYGVDALPPLVQADLEALSNDEGNNNCNNVNGYRQWNTSGKLFQRKSAFYDGCYVETVFASVQLPLT